MAHLRKSFIYVNSDYGFEYHIVLPFEDSVEELVHIIIIKHNLPIYLETGNFDSIYVYKTIVFIYNYFRID